VRRNKVWDQTLHFQTKRTKHENEKIL
jgi:hypothetical protein